MNTNSNLAYVINQEPSPAPFLLLVQKPAIAVGTIIHFKAFGVQRDLPILKVVADPWGRDFETYIVENPMWTPDSQFPPYMPIFSNSFMNKGYGATVELTPKQQILIDAMNALEMAHQYKKEARQAKPLAVAHASVQPVATAKGFGFHDVVESELLEGDKAEADRCKAKAAEWMDIYNGKIEAYKAVK